MSSQAVRNNITTSIRRVITDVKRKAIAEGKKKVMELKDQLLNPDQIIRMLTADINQDSCSIEGRNKLKEKADKLKKQLDDIADVAEQGLKVMTDLEEKIGVISSKAEIPDLPNPIENIKGITDAIKPITDTLRYVIMAAPAILASQVAVPGGGSSSGLVIANTNNSVNLAKAKIAEFTNLFRSLPTVLDKYIFMADVVFQNITKIKSQIQMIVDEINKLEAFIDYLELDFLSKCNELQLPVNPPVPDPPIIQQIPPECDLACVISKAEELYGNLLESLIAQGEHRAIRRVYALGVSLQRIKNTKVEQIYIGTGEDLGLSHYTNIQSEAGGRTEFEDQSGNWDYINNP